MELARARSYEEVGYLAAIFVVSLALSSHLITIVVLFKLADIVPILIPILFPFVPFLPFLPHLPGFVYAKRTSNRRGDYYFALAVSFVLSQYSHLHYRLRDVGMGTVPVHLVWYEEIALLTVTLLVPTFHAYLRYDGDLREVVLLVLIYAPWVQLIRMGIAYLSLI
jgi:hypothetical protein